MSISIYEYMQDFDNQELTPDERQEALEAAVEDYNSLYGTNYNPKTYYRNYLSWLKDQED